MRIEYDPEANALYIRFQDVKPVDNIDIEDGLTVDLDDQKRLIGIEILDVSHRLPPDTLATITVQNLLTANPPEGSGTDERRHEASSPASARQTRYYASGTCGS